MNKTQEQEENYSEWVSTRLLDDEYITTYSQDILSKPKFVLSSTDSELDKENLYSAEQMLEMFRYGFLSVSKTDFGKRALPRGPKKKNSPYATIRQLSVGERAVFPYKQWRSIRVAASKIHADFGSTFRVTKLAPVNRIGDIEVIRLS